MKTAFETKIPISLSFLLIILCGAVAAAQPEGAPSSAILKPRNGLPNIFSREKNTPVHIVYLRIPPCETDQQNKLQPLFQKIWKSSSIEYISIPLSEAGSRLLSADLAVIETAAGSNIPYKRNQFVHSLEEELRLIWRQKSQTDLLFLYTCSPEESFDSLYSSNLEYLADFYGIPSIDLTRSAAEEDPLSAIERPIRSIRNEEESPTFPGKEAVNRTRTEKAEGPPVFRE